MGKSNNISSSYRKWTAMVTYIIALVCLLAGLLIPLGNVDGFTASNMLALQLPQAAGAVIGKSWSIGSTFTYNFGINFMGLFKGGSFNIGALLVVLYALITLAALIGLVPVIASKKDSRTAFRAASFIEVLALVVLSVLLITQLETFIIGGGYIKFSFALLIAFGGTLLMLIVQALSHRKGSGFIKFILFLLSGIALFFIIFNITDLIPALASALGGKLANGLYDGEDGISHLLILFSTKYTLDGDIKEKLLMVFTLITALLVVINYLFDLFGLAKRTRRHNLIFNVIRYSLEVVSVIVVLVMVLVLKASAGLALYALVGIAVVQLIINILRLVSFKTVKKTKKTTVKQETVKETVVVTQTRPVETVAPVATNTVTAAPVEEKIDKKEEKRKAKEAEKAAKEAEKAAREAEKEAAKAAAAAAKAQPVEEVATAPEAVYNVEPLYNGPVDDFIRKLSNAERIEFARVFLERSTGVLPNVPDYVVGGANVKFFSSVFIYYGRIRDYVSDGLMNKLYEQGNIMQ